MRTKVIVKSTIFGDIEVTDTFIHVVYRGGAETIQFKRWQSKNVTDASPNKKSPIYREEDIALYYHVS